MQNLKLAQKLILWKFRDKIKILSIHSLIFSVGNLCSALSNGRTIVVVVVSPSIRPSVVRLLRMYMYCG